MLKTDIFVVTTMSKIDIFLVTVDWLDMLPYFHALLPPTLDHTSPIDLDVYLESWGSPFHFELMWLGKDFAKLVPNRWG